MQYSEEFKKEILDIFFESDGIYGYRRVAVAANKENETLKVSERVVRRVMQEEDLKAKQAKKNPYNSYRGIQSTVAQNIMNRKFKSAKPLEKISTDITEFKIGKQKVYLSPLIDLFSGELISHTRGLHPTVAFVLEMFDEKNKSKA